MKKRVLCGHQVTEVGLGTWQLGNADWGNVSEEKAFQIMERYVQLGGNLIDTADVYGAGVSEKIIGKFIKHARSKVLVLTKLGRRTDNSYGWPDNFTYQTMKDHVQDSMERLGVGSLFLEQLHCIPKDELQRGRVFDHLRRLQEEGYIDNWGASVETIDEALVCLEQEGLASLQIIFNIFRQDAVEKLLCKAQEKNVAIIARVPLASGLLTGKFNASTVFGFDDHRNYNANGEYFNVGETFAGLSFQEGVVLADALKKILPEGSMATWALRWILDHPQVSAVIPGASKISQVESNMKASELDLLSAEKHAELKLFYENDVRGLIRGEV